MKEMVQQPYSSITFHFCKFDLMSYLFTIYSVFWMIVTSTVGSHKAHETGPLKGQFRQAESFELRFYIKQFFSGFRVL